MTDAVNLYAPPKAPVEDVSPAADEAHEIRKAHIKTEMAIRSIGVLYCIGGLVVSAIAVALLRGLLSGASDLPDSFRAGLVGVLAVGGVGSFFLARGLRQLREWARITTLILTAIGVLGALAGPTKAPLGALFNACILYLL